jgi:hypothetical protein
MLNILKDGPFRYIHSVATGELILTLQQVAGGFMNLDHWTKPRSLREWKAVARRRMGDQLITDNDGR